MVLKCFTCDEAITFDDTILSKTGKKIPLWPDKKNTHGHDDNGEPIRGDLPETQLQPKQQFYPSSQQTRAPPSTTQGGASLDTRRTIQALTEIMAELREIKEILNSRTILDTNRYEGKNDQIYHVIAPFLNTQGVIASELIKDEKYRREQEQIKKWQEPKEEDNGVSDAL